MSVLGTRPGPGGTTLPAIISARVDSGYFLGLIYDWGDAFTQTPPLANTQQLIANALAIPEPASWALMIMATNVTLRFRRRYTRAS